MPFDNQTRKGPFVRRVASSAAALLLMICGAATADDLSMFDGALRRMQIDERIKPQSDTPFGEQINPYIGSVSFKQADVVVPGNGPTISLMRETLTPRNNYRSLVPHALGDWTLSVPQIHTIAGKPGFPSGTVAEYWDIDSLQTPYARCTQIGPLDTDSVVNTLWWEGYEMITEDGERQALLKRDPANTAKPTMTLNGQPVVFPAVTEKNWQIGCLPNTSNGEIGEAFFAVSPDGTKYWFDYLTGEGLETIKEMDDGVIVRQSVKRARMLVTRIEDRFGNYLTYQYDDGKLISIDASDGRKVTLAWRADYRLVDSITVQPAAPQPRVWRYEYVNLGDTTSRLTGVVLPDLTRWSFALHPQTSRVLTNLRPCGVRGVLPASDVTATQTIASPTGLVGSFTYKQIWHARYVDSSCVQMPNMDPYEETSPLFETQSLVRREISGPGVAPQAWIYAYEPAVGATTYDPCNQSGTCPTTKWVDVTDPEAGRTRYTYSIVNGTDGRLLDQDTYQGATLLRSESYEYAEANQGPWPVMLGSPMASENPAGAIFQWTPIKKRIIAQQGTTFTWQVNSFDNFANPLSVTRSNTLGQTRTDITAYHHDIAKWVIGQPASFTNTGLVESHTNYHPNALPWKTYAFGKLQQTLTYHADGTLATATDGNNHTTSFANWKRGIPQLVTFADTTSKSAAVNDLGQINSVTDENGYTTAYSYDVMGRLTLIDYPDSDTVNWNSTTISFAPAAATPYGLPNGHWRRTESTGTARKITYYDAFWRPVIVEVYDTANTWGTITQTITRYDADGRPTFASYPQRVADSAVYGTWANPAVVPNATGTWTTYDALGRPTQVQQNSELGLLTSTHQYLSNFQTLTTNPRGTQTVTQYQAFDQPSTEAPSGITTFAGADTAATEIYRDIFGKPTQLKRRNDAGTLVSSRYYVYDGHQQLCKMLEPETGATVMDYDAAGNLAWTAAGVSAPSASSCNHTEAAASGRVVFRTYDARNRLNSLMFPDGVGNQEWLYWLDGQPRQITTYNTLSGTQVVNNYTYNKRRLLTGESQAQPGMPVWSLGYGYSVNGAMASTTYPDGLAVTYAPNALGQPTQAGSYATGVSYFANGGMQQFTYGNGIVHTMIQNARQLPDQSIDSGGVLNDSYDYDANGNVAAISDGLAGARGNRTMSYDGLDRLKTTTSPMFVGGAAYDYDALDNLTRVTAPGRDHYYCYDNQWRLSNVKTGSCNGTSVIGLGYDVQGNLANKNGTLYQFDYGNRLRNVPDKETYRYDGHGRRVWAQADQGTIYSFYGQDGALRYQRDERKGEAYDYITLNGSLVARATDPNPVIGVPTLSAPASSSNGTYTVQWTAVTLATQYEVQEALNGGAWQAAYAGTAISLNLSSQPSGSYGYRARACKNAVCGNWSATATVVVALPPASAPTLTVPATAPNGNYSVGWTAVNGANSYTLEESVNGGAWTGAYTGANLSQAYTSKPAGGYAYRVKACNPNGCSGVSATGTTQTIYAPGVPTVTVPASSYDGNYTVSWAAVSTATSYQLEESANGGAWTLVQNAAATSKAYTGKADGSYSYRGKACNAAGCSALSAATSVQVLTPPTAVPTVTAPANNTTGSYAVSWTTVPKATSYTLHVKVNGATNGTNIYGGAGTSHNISGQGEGSYAYYVLACNGAGCANWSAPATTQVQFPPAMPASLTGYAEYGGPPAGLRDFYLNWGSVAGATYYELQQIWAGGTTIIYGGPATSFELSGHGTRTFNVRACNPAGCSAWKGPLTL